MKYNKDINKSGYRKDYFDTNISCYVTKRTDDPRTPEEWWFSLKSILEIRNRFLQRLSLIDINGIPIKDEQFKEK